jgi:hypothetical protein
MEEKRRNIPKNKISVKIREIQPNFKNARKVSYSKDSECVKREKRVMFLEPPKEIKTRNMKKTQVIMNPKFLEQKLHTEIEQAISKKKRKKVRNPSLKKCHTSNSFIKMPALKTKVVNINTHFFMPVIGNFQPRTFVTKNNPLKGQQKKMKYKRNNTFEKNVLNKNSEELNNIIKKTKSNKKESKKEILRKNTKENGRRNENKFGSNQNNIIPYVHDIKYNENNPNPETESKKMKSITLGENTFNTGINENNKEEDIKEINDSNKINEKDDNLTNKSNVHKKNNSVDVKNLKKEKKNMNCNIFKKLFCCLNG